MYTVLLVIHTIVVLFLIMMILLQRTDSDGMGGLGGGGGNQFMTGRAQANLMTRTTAILAAAFMISSLVLAIYGSHMTSGSIMDSVPAADAQAPAAPKDQDTLAKDKATDESAPPATDKAKTDKASKHEEKSKPSVPKPE